MSSSTLRWVVRAVGVLMVIFFAYILCSMQQQLMRLQQERRLVPAESPVPSAGTPPPATPTPP